MGIKVEFNPDLALRAFGTPGRLEEECLPENLKEKTIFAFLKEGQRNYWLEGEIPLLETKGNQLISKPLASIRILEVIHFLKDGKPYTKGTYQVIEAYTKEDKEIHFEGFTKK
jgi:hypothetical protein